MELTRDALRDIFTYIKSTGEFYSKVLKNDRMIVKRIGYTVGNNYLGCKINKVRYMLHHLVWLMETGELPQKPLQIDHINGVKTDNRIENLRLATNKQNSRNRTVVLSSSGFLGVTKEGNKYRAKIMVDGMTVHLGGFNTPEKAHSEYLKAKKILHHIE